MILFRSESLKESKTNQTRSTSLVKFLNKISLSFNIIILPTENLNNQYRGTGKEILYIHVVNILKF